MNAEILVSDALVRALGWTLAHSLWQGAFAAFLLLILLPRLQSARQRYRAAYGALTSMLTAAAVTFAWVWSPVENVPANPGAAMAGAPVASGFIIENQAFDKSVWQTVSGWLEGHYSLIVAVWLLGFVFFLLRLASGLWHVEHLRRHGTFLVDDAWHEKIASYCGQLGISRAVGLFESALVHTPTALGWLKHRVS